MCWRLKATAKQCFSEKAVAKKYYPLLSPASRIASMLPSNYKLNTFISWLAYKWACQNGRNCIILWCLIQYTSSLTVHIIYLSKKHNTVVRRCSIQLKIQSVYCCKAWQSTALQQLSSETRFPANCFPFQPLIYKSQPPSFNKYLFTVFFHSTAQLTSLHATYSTKTNSLAHSLFLASTRSLFLEFSFHISIA